MTVEQLNVIITAQTEDFQAKIAAVNEALANTAALAQTAAQGLVDISLEKGFTKDFAAAGVSEISQEGHQASLSAVDVPEAAPTEQLPPLSATIPEISGAAASVLGFRSGDTLIEAVSGGKGEANKQAPIEIYTTVELDGEKVGQAVGLYNASRSRITNGRS